MLAHTIAPGAASFSWFSGNTNSTTVLSPSSTGVFSVTGISVVKGCSAAKRFIVAVMSCNSLRKTEESEFFFVYPNPASSTLEIKIKYDAQIHVYNLSDILCLSAARQAGEHQLDLTSLPAGLYYIVAEGKGGKKLVTRKLIWE